MSKTSRGLPLQSKASGQKTSESEALLRGDDIRPFYNVPPSLYLAKSYLEKNRAKVEALKQPKIISQRIVAHVLTPVDHIIIMSTLDEEGLLDVDTVENTIVTSPDYDMKYILAFLNSKFVSWFAYTFIFNKAVRTMDFDDYYVGKIPMFPASEDEQKPVTGLVERLLRLTRLFVKSKAEFREYVNKYPRLDDMKLEAYYRDLPASDKKVLIQSNLKGTIKNVSVQENEDWLVFKIDYSMDKEDHLEVEVLKLNIGNAALAGFIAQSVLNRKKHLAKGNILERLLQFTIPRFSKDEQKNLQVIKEIMSEYRKVSSKHAQLEREISDLENAINQKIYQFYDLSEDEIEFIESSFGKESVALKMLR